MQKLVATKKFKAELVREYSATPTPEPMGTFDNTMDLYTPDGTINGGTGSINWEYENMDDPDDEGDGVGIGLLWNKDTKELTDYDGVFSLPQQAIELIESVGITVDETFRD